MPVQYVNVTEEQGALERMLEYSKGRRDVPVIVEDEKVILGFGGGT